MEDIHRIEDALLLLPRLPRRLGVDDLRQERIAVRRPPGGGVGRHEQGAARDLGAIVERRRRGPRERGLGGRLIPDGVETDGEPRPCAGRLDASAIETIGDAEECLAAGVRGGGEGLGPQGAGGLDPRRRWDRWLPGPPRPAGLLVARDRGPLGLVQEPVRRIDDAVAQVAEELCSGLRVERLRVREVAQVEDDFSAPAFLRGKVCERLAARRVFRERAQVERSCALLVPVREAGLRACEQRLDVRPAE